MRDVMILGATALSQYSQFTLELIVINNKMT